MMLREEGYEYSPFLVPAFPRLPDLSPSLVYLEGWRPEYRGLTGRDEEVLQVH